MVPSDCTRRRALQAIGAATALALAGCNESDGNDGPTPRGNAGERVVDHEVLKARWRPDAPVFQIEPRDEDDDLEPGRSRFVYITSKEDENRVTYGSTPAANTFESFVENTDLAAHSIVMYQQQVPECYHLVLASVHQEPDGDIHLEFCRNLRSADVECSVDTHERVGYAIRLPFAIEDPSGYGVGHGSSCNRGPVPRTPVTTPIDSGGESE